MEAAFLTELEREYSELLETGKIQLIEDVQKKTAKQFHYKVPIYFVGNIRSRIALVTFNSSKNYLTEGKQPINFRSYQIKQQNLGNVYSDNCLDKVADSDYSSDVRMLNYLKPFQVIRFDKSSLQRNLQKLTDEKLQLDLVPYVTSDFSAKDFMLNYPVCKPFVDRLLSGVLAYPRQYVIFTGDYFKEILSEYIEESERFSFLLTSPNKVNQKVFAHFTRVTLNYKGRRIVAGIADSYFDENFDELMLEKYGQESVSILSRGLLLSNPLWNINNNLIK